MLGGGEEFFQAPPGHTIETLKAFAVFCAKLRQLNQIGGKRVGEVCALAKGVGTRPVDFELVVGTLFRRIKALGTEVTGLLRSAADAAKATASGAAGASAGAPSSSSAPADAAAAAEVLATKCDALLATWYVLHALCREAPHERYSHEAAKYILEVAGDYIPWEDAARNAKYQDLIKVWHKTGLFEDYIVRGIWQSQEARAERIRDPAKYEAQLRDEEKEWKLEEIRQRDDGNLNEYGQPCMDYLQGKCSWGDACKQLHPPGLEGTLPPECRLGDWKCVCGTINRHFRRRCSGCPKEKPQFRRNLQQSKEDQLLSNAEDLTAIFRHQFGYDPFVEAEAVSFWARRLASYTPLQYREERSASYRERILPFITNPKAAACLRRFQEKSRVLSGGGILNNNNNADNDNPEENDKSPEDFIANPAARQRLHFAPSLPEDHIRDSFEPSAAKKLRTEGGGGGAGDAGDDSALTSHGAQAMLQQTSCSPGTLAAIAAAAKKLHFPALASTAPRDRLRFISRAIIDRGVLDAGLPDLLYVFVLTLNDFAAAPGGLQGHCSGADDASLIASIIKMVFDGFCTKKITGAAVPFFSDMYWHLFGSSEGDNTNSGAVGQRLPAGVIVDGPTALPTEFRGQLKTAGVFNQSQAERATIMIVEALRQAHTPLAPK